MSEGEGTIRLTAHRVWSFTKRVLTLFVANKGLLLAGAVAYNTLLSVIPLLAILLVVAAAFFEPTQLLEIIATELELIAPGRGHAVAAEIGGFLANKDVVGWVGFFVLLFFGSIAFRILEDAMALIFSRTPTPKKRHFLVSAALPYAYILALGVALLVISGFSVLLEAVARDVSWLGTDTSVSVLLYAGGLFGQVVLFTSIYRILPVATVSLKRALVGAIIATVLWEGTRQFLSWYFDNLSLVNVVYGSLATVIVVLLSMEIAAIIVLLGAQVIAELERSADAGVPWYVIPEDKRRRGQEERPQAWQDSVSRALEKLSAAEIEQIEQLDPSLLLPDGKPPEDEDEKAAATQ